MCPAVAVDRTLRYCENLQTQIPVSHRLLPASTLMPPLKVDYQKYLSALRGLSLPASSDIEVNLARNQVHYVFAYHYLAKSARNECWKRINQEWTRRGKIHSPAELRELRVGIDKFVDLLIKPIFHKAVPYAPELFKRFLLNDNVPEEELLTVLDSTGKSPRFQFRMSNFFNDYQHVIDQYREAWNVKILRAEPDMWSSQEYQTMSHALASLVNAYDAYFEVF